MRIDYPHGRVNCIDFLQDPGHGCPGGARDVQRGTGRGQIESRIDLLLVYPVECRGQRSVPPEVKALIGHSLDRIDGVAGLSLVLPTSAGGYSMRHRIAQGERVGRDEERSRSDRYRGDGGCALNRRPLVVSEPRHPRLPRLRAIASHAGCRTLAVPASAARDQVRAVQGRPSRLVASCRHVRCATIPVR